MMQISRLTHPFKWSFWLLKGSDTTGTASALAEKELFLRKISINLPKETCFQTELILEWKVLFHHEETKSLSGMYP